MPKYVFCDLDYTLLNDNRDISKENLEAIKNFENKGNHFIMCSGRVSFALKSYRDLLNASEVITSNGAMVESKNKVIRKQLLDKDVIIKITKYCIDRNINVRYFSCDLMYLLNQEAGSKKAILYKERKTVDNKTIFDVIENEEIIKVVLCSDDMQVLDDAKKEFNNMNLNIEIARSLDIFLEVNALNQNKGNGILDYCKYNNIDIKDTVSIGDNNNDLSMLRITGFSACPSNAIDNIKEVVDLILDNDNNHSAIKELLEKIG